jgi:hypothetical protein
MIPRLAIGSAGTTAMRASTHPRAAPFGPGEAASRGRRHHASARRAESPFRLSRGPLRPRAGPHDAHRRERATARPTFLGWPSETSGPKIESAAEIAGALVQSERRASIGSSLAFVPRRA